MSKDERQFESLIALLGESQSSIALGEMLEKLAKIQVFTYDSEWTIEQEGGSVQVILSKVYFSEHDGHRSDTHLGSQIVAQTFTPLEGNQITQVFPSSKKVMKATMTERQIVEMRQKFDPRWWLADLEDYHTIDLGRKVEVLSATTLEELEQNQVFRELIETPRGPWIFFKGTDKLEFTPFSSGQQTAPHAVFGSCALCIKAKE